LPHRAGLPAIRRVREDADIDDWGLVATALAQEEPWWEPGTKHGYHVNTFGFLTGELIRRVAGQSIGTFFNGAVAGPLDADFHFGLGPEHDSRTAEYFFATESIDGGEDREPIDDERRLLLNRAYLNPPGISGLGTVNTR